MPKIRELELITFNQSSLKIEYFLAQNAGGDIQGANY